MDPLALQILETRTVTDESGASHPLHSQTSRTQCELLIDLVRQSRPRVSLEVGLAYGISTLALCHALKDVGAQRHIVMDPHQSRSWKGIGLLNVRRAGYGELVDFREQYAHDVMPELLKDGTTIDFAYLDGAKMFDVVLVNIYYLTKILRDGALLVLDDCNFPGIRRVCAFMLTHPSYELYGAWDPHPDKTPRRVTRSVLNALPGSRRWLAAELRYSHPKLRDNPHCIAFRKVKADERKWDWYEPF